MKKKPLTTPAIPPAQFDALRRLARSNHIWEALRRLDVLKTRHPDYKPLYGLAWELASMAPTPHWATERAWDWTRAAPNSRTAWQALRDGALAADYLALSLAADDRLIALAGEPIPVREDLDTPFGKMRFEEALANDTARLFMAVASFDKALAALAGFDHVSLRNNTAVIYFQQGDIPGALSVFEENWQREPRNLFALEHLVRLRLWTGGLDTAAGLVAPLKITPAERPDDALAKVHALLILGDWQSADAAWREAANADYWQGPQEINKSALFDFAGGIAALRLGNLEAMSDRFGDAADSQAEWRDLVRQIEIAALAPQISEAPDIPVGRLPEWFPQAWINQISNLEDASLTEGKVRYGALLAACNAHPDYLSVVTEMGGEAGRTLALDILKRRANKGDDAALQAMIALLARPCGPDKVRSGLHTYLVEGGLVPKGGTVSMLAQGRVHKVLHLAFNLHATASPPDLPPESHARLEKVFDLIAKNRLADGIGILQELIAKHPDVPSLYNNLASIKEGLKHPDEEIEALMEKARAIDPDYLFAITGLARLAARRGEIDRAKTLIEPLLGHESYHFTEWRSILMTQLEMAKQLGERGAVFNIQKQIADLQERFD